MRWPSTSSKEEGNLHHRGSPNDHASQLLSSAAGSARGAPECPQSDPFGRLGAANDKHLHTSLQLLSLLKSWEDKWFGCSTGGLGNFWFNSSRSHHHHDRAGTASKTQQLLPTDEQGRGFTQLSHCWSLRGSVEQSPVYLTEAGCAELGIGAWQQQAEQPGHTQQQQQQQDHERGHRLHDHRAVAAAHIALAPPSTHATAAAGPPGLAALHYHHMHLHHRHSQATLSPEDGHTPEHAGVCGAGCDVPQGKSLSAPCDPPTMGALRASTTTLVALVPPSPSLGSPGACGGISPAPGSSSASPALPVMSSVVPSSSPDHHTALLARSAKHLHNSHMLTLLPPPEHGHGGSYLQPTLCLHQQGGSSVHAHLQQKQQPEQQQHVVMVPMLPPSSATHSSVTHSSTTHSPARASSTYSTAAATAPDQAVLLGTWAHRQFRLLGDAGEHPSGAAGPGSAHAACSQPGSIASSVAAPAPPPPLPLAGHGMRSVHSAVVLGSSTDLQDSTAAATTAHHTKSVSGQRSGGTPRLLAPLPEPQQQQQLQLGGPEGEVAPSSRPQGTSDSGSDEAVEAAWRWRFARRWHAEQQRSAQAPDPHSGSLDKTEEALAYLRAGGGAGWNMQVAMARTHSTEQSGFMLSVGTQGLGSLMAGEMLLDEGGSFNPAQHQHECIAHAAAAQHPLALPPAPRAVAGEPAHTDAAGPQHHQQHRSTGTGPVSAWAHQQGPGDLSATRMVNSLNRRAVQLLEKQQQLERKAEELWNTSVCCGENWVGQHLPTVEIDEWGTFKFLVVRVRGRNDRQRILVRGRNYCSEGQVIEDINRKMAVVAAQKSCPTEMLEVMGGGVMEWRRERDRHLHLHSGFSALPSLGAAGKPASGQELLNLAAVLAKQHLPVNFKVSIQGGV